jgi:hypothetical protein
VHLTKYAGFWGLNVLSSIKFENYPLECAKSYLESVVFTLCLFFPGKSFLVMWKAKEPPQLNM